MISARLTLGQSRYYSSINAVLTCVSVRLRLSARLSLSQTDRHNIEHAVQYCMHVLTCVSVKLRLSARLSLSHTERYRVVLNLFSRLTSCSYVKAVRALIKTIKSSMLQYVLL
jgi:hypothetical protein